MGNILDLLNDSLLHVEVKRRGGQDVAGDSKVTLMNLLGEEIGEKVNGLCLHFWCVCVCMYVKHLKPSESLDETLKAASRSNTDGLNK